MCAQSLVDFQMLRYWCASKAEQRVEERIKNYHLITRQQYSDCFHRITRWGWELNSALVFLQRKATSRGSYGNKPTFLQTSICILKCGKDEGRRGFVSCVSSVVFPLNSEQTITVGSKTMHAQVQRRWKTFEGRDSTRFKLRCAQASLYLCTLLYLCSLDWQKLRVHWAKAILVNSLPFMRRVIPHLFQLSFARACRDEPRKTIHAASHSFAPENFTLDCFSPPLIWPSVFFPTSLIQTIKWGWFEGAYSCRRNSSWPCCVRSRQTNSRFVFRWRRPLFMSHSLFFLRQK